MESGERRFWESTSPFVTNKGARGNEEDMLEEKVRNNPKQISEILNEYYLNIWSYYYDHAGVSTIRNSHLSYYYDHASVSTVRNSHLSYYYDHATVSTIRNNHLSYYYGHASVSTVRNSHLSCHDDHASVSAESRKKLFTLLFSLMAPL